MTGWGLAARRSAGGIRADERRGNASGGGRVERGRGGKVNKSEMVRSGPRPFGSLRGLAATMLAAAIPRTERRFRRRCVLRASNWRSLGCTVMTVHRRLGFHSGRSRERTPHAALHGRRSNARERQRPEDRHKHDEQRDSGCPAVHDYLFARRKHEPIPHADCAHHTITRCPKASAEYRARPTNNGELRSDS